MNTDIAYSRATPEADLTVDVPAVGVYIVDHGDTYEVERHGVTPAKCGCTDDTHQGYGPWTGRLHDVEVHTYVITGRAMKEAWHG